MTKPRLLNSGAAFPDLLADLLVTSTPRQAVAALLRETAAAKVKNKSLRGWAFEGRDMPESAFVDEFKLAELSETKRELEQSLLAIEKSVAARHAELASRCAHAETVLANLREAREVARSLGADGTAVLDALARPPLSPTSARQALQAFEAMNQRWAEQDCVPEYATELAGIHRQRIGQIKVEMAAERASGEARLADYRRVVALAKELESDTGGDCGQVPQ